MIYICNFVKKSRFTKITKKNKKKNCKCTKSIRIWFKKETKLKLAMTNIKNHKAEEKMTYVNFKVFPFLNRRKLKI